MRSRGRREKRKERSRRDRSESGGKKETRKRLSERGVEVTKRPGGMTVPSLAEPGSRVVGAGETERGRRRMNGFLRAAAADLTETEKVGGVTLPGEPLLHLETEEAPGG